MNDPSDRLVEAAESGRFFEVLEAVWNEPSTADGGITLHSYLIALHNGRRLDLIDLYCSLTNHGRERLNFFSFYRVLVEVLPSLATEPELLLRCVSHLIEEAGNDLASGMVLPALELWMQQEDNRAETLLAAADAAPEEGRQVLTNVLRVIAADQGVEEAMALAVSRLACGHSGMEAAAAFTLGDLPLERGRPEAEERIRHLRSWLKRVRDETACANVVAAAVGMVRSEHMAAEAALVLVREAIGADSGLGPLRVLRQRVATWVEKLPTAFVADCVLILADAGPPPEGQLREADHICSALLKREGAADIAIGTVEALLLHDPKKGRAFGDDFASFCEAARADDGRLLRDFLIRWMMSPRLDLRNALREAVEDADDDRGLIVLPDEVAGMPTVTLEFLALRALATFLLRPKSLVGFWLRLYEATAEEGLREQVEGHLFDFAGVNFPESSTLRLRVACDGGDGSLTKTREMSGRVLDRIEAFQRSLDDAETLPELRPSSRRRRSAAVRKNRQMADIYRQGEERSVLLSILSRQTILYGRGSFYTRDPEERDAPERVETVMQSWSHSMEIPRASIVDFIGYERLLTVSAAVKLVGTDGNDEATPD